MTEKLFGRQWDEELSAPRHAQGEADDWEAEPDYPVPPPEVVGFVTTELNSRMGVGI